MREFYKYFILIIFAATLGCGQKTSEYDFSVIFTANTKGLIEHCNCRIKRGRILERKTLLDNVKRDSENFFLFDAGQSISSFHLHRDKLLGIMRDLEYTAYFVSAFEYNDTALQGFFIERSVNDKYIDFSSFTILNENNERIFKPYIEKTLMGEKHLFISITGYSNIPDYYKNIHLLSLEDALNELGKISQDYFSIFLITDYRGIEDLIAERGIGNVKYIFRIDRPSETTEPILSEGIKFLVLPTGGEFFWQIGLKKENSEIIYSEMVHDVILGTSINKKFKQRIERVYEYNFL